MLAMNSCFLCDPLCRLYYLPGADRLLFHVARPSPVPDDD